MLSTARGKYLALWELIQTIRSFFNSIDGIGPAGDVVGGVHQIGVGNRVMQLLLA